MSELAELIVAICLLTSTVMGIISYLYSKTNGKLKLDYNTIRKIVSVFIHNPNDIVNFALTIQQTLKDKKIDTKEVAQIIKNLNVILEDVAQEIEKNNGEN